MPDQVNGFFNQKLASDELGIAYWVMDFVDGDFNHPDNQFTVSDECRRMLGFADEHDLPNRVSSLSSQLHPDEKEWVIKAIEDHVSDRTGQTPYETEYRIRMKSGEYRYFHAFGSTKRDEDGVPLRLTVALKDITDYMVIQEKEREAEEFIHLLMDANPLVANLWNRDIQNTYTNAAAVNLFDLSSKQEYIDNFHKLSPEFQPNGENSVDLAIKKVKEAFETGYCQFEWMHQKLNGEPVPGEVTLVRVAYKDDYLVAGYTRDLRKEIEMQKMIADEQAKSEALMLHQLEEAESRKALDTITHVLSGLDALIYVTDPETNEIIFINDNMIEYYGVDKDCVGKLCYKVFHKDKDAQCDFCPCLKLDKDPDKVIYWEEYRPEHDKTHLHAERYISWPDGKTVHLRHSVDITDIRNATKELDKKLVQQNLITQVSQIFLPEILYTDKLHSLIAEALNMLGEFMDVAHIVLYVLDLDRLVFTCRNQWISPDIEYPNLIGKDYPANISEMSLKFFDRMKNREASYMSSDEPIVREIMGAYRKHFENYLCTTIYVGDDLYGMLDFSWKNDGRKWSKDDLNLVEFLTNVLTVSFHRSMVAQQVIKSKELAEEGNRSKSIFLASMSHEIRTPLNAILGIAEIQLMESNLPPDLNDAFYKIYESGDLLLNIINDILDHSKIEAGKLEILPVRYDMPSLINDTIQLMRLRYESKPLSFKLHVDENTPLDLFGDELRIKQILSNLLSNAFKYTDDGTVTMSVSFEPGRDKEDVTIVFTVSDTGQGMTEDQVDRLFDEYTRFNLQTNRSTVGTGLGMNITKRFVELMKGDITVQSEAGKGSVFTVRLPQQRIGGAVCGPELVQKLQKNSLSSTFKTHKTQISREYMPYGNVLVVDDVESNLYVAKGLLLAYGLKIETVESGFEAIDRVKNGKCYDIIFMDHMMPHMDGMEAAKIIRGMGYDQPIVALTANAVAGQAEYFIANGFDGFLSKPIDLRELNTILNDLIRSKQPPEVIKEARGKKKELAALARKQERPSGEIEKAFLRDAEKTAAVLSELCDTFKTGEEADLQLFVVSVHGIKNALTNVGEHELSSDALKLELAGRDGDIDSLRDKTPAFLLKLRTLIFNMKPAAGQGDGPADVGEDVELLREKMAQIHSACDVYDKKTAKAALDELKQKQWSGQTAGKIDAIAVHLLHGTFKEAMGIAEELLK
ncbi:MAG: ATP-binding protein [Oscillospiraceae bacterium]|nr:ATP-binding protein [Oscillospiraceae bacterium]